MMMIMMMMMIMVMDDDDCDCFEILSAVPPCSLLPLIAAPISAGSTTVLVVYYTLATSSILAY